MRAPGEVPLSWPDVLDPPLGAPASDRRWSRPPTAHSDSDSAPSSLTSASCDVSCLVSSMSQCRTRPPLLGQDAGLAREQLHGFPIRSSKSRLRSPRASSRRARRLGDEPAGVVRLSRREAFGGHKRVLSPRRSARAPSWGKAVRRNRQLLHRFLDEGKLSEESAIEKRGGSPASRERRRSRRRLQEWNVPTKDPSGPPPTSFCARSAHLTGGLVRERDWPRSTKAWPRSRSAAPGDA